MADQLDHSLLSSVRKHLTRFGVTQTSAILVGVSGGMDSMVLISVLHRLGYAVSAGHVNFNLRGVESVNDAHFVRKWCIDQGIPFYELSRDTKAYAQESNLNTQSAAREIRYAWWESLVHGQQFEFVATAHHLNDTIETVLLNLLRGTGLKGLKGIPPVRGFYVRPLIESKRSEIESYAIDYNIPFRTDESNDSDEYQRNRLRHHLLPLMEELSPGFLTSMKHTLHRVNLEWESWEHAYGNWVSQHVTRDRDAFLIKGLSQQLAFKLRWLEEKGLPWMLAYDFLNATKAGSGQVLQYNTLRLSRTEDGHCLEESHPPVEIIIHKPGRYALGNFILTIERIPVEAYTKVKDQWTEYVNEAVVQWPLYIRNIKTGDYFRPLGMNGKTQKIQDFMVNHKLEMFEKERLLLLTNSDHILWVIGLRLDERAKVGANEKSVYRITYMEVTKG